MTTDRPRVLCFRLLLLLTMLVGGPASRAQDKSGSAPASQGVDSGDYNIRQSVEFGYRADWINGNKQTYNTFINLGRRRALVRLHPRNALPRSQRACCSIISVSATSDTAAIRTTFRACASIKTNGMTFSFCFAGTRIFGITTSLRTL